MYHGAGYDPYHFPYYRNEFYQPYPNQMNPHPMQPQDIQHHYALHPEPNQAYPMHQEMNYSYPPQQVNPYHQPTQANEENYPPNQQPPAQNMPEQPNGAESSSQSPFEYFQKPEQPMNWPNNTAFDPAQFQQNQQMQQGIISQFQNQNGQLDVDKVIGTVGQLANTYHQVAPIFKQFGSLVKNFRVGG